MRNGITLFELLLVTAVLAILAASSVPFMMRTTSWFYDISRSETAINQLYDTGMVVSRAITQDKALLANLSIAGNTLSYDGQILQTGVNATWNTESELGGVVIFNISTVAEPVESMRFVILPLR